MPEKEEKRTLQNSYLQYSQFQKLINLFWEYEGPLKSIKKSWLVLNLALTEGFLQVH